MKKKKTIVIIIIALIILLIILLFTIISVNKQSNKIEMDNNKTTEKNEKIEIENDDEEKQEEEELPTEENPTTTQTTTTTTTTVRTTTTTRKTTKATTRPTTTTTKPASSYSCPNGYTLSGTKCTSVINASYECPPNTYDYSNEGIPRDKYCVNLSEGYDTDSTNCPSGYGSIQVISLGSETKYRCIPLHEKRYTCPDGYTLSGTKCTKTIDATLN